MIERFSNKKEYKLGLKDGRREGAIQTYEQIKKDFGMAGLNLYCDRKLMELKWANTIAFLKENR